MSHIDIPEFHVLSFEGPDAYARAGGIASRISGLCQTLADGGLPTHLWYVGDPALPGHETAGELSLHRWCQWISAYHPAGVYDGEEGKLADYSSSLPPYLLERLAPRLRAGGRAVVLAEEWHTAGAVLELDALLRAAGLRSQVTLLWNANNTFGFHRIDWGRLARAATITTVSRYMRQHMLGMGVSAVAIPNGLGPDAFVPVDRALVREVRERAAGRVLLTKMARFDPDKQWLSAIDAVAELKARGLSPLLVARGGIEAHGREVLARASELRLCVRKVEAAPGAGGLIEALRDVASTDLILLESHVDAEARGVLFRAAHAVLANSSHEPFGLVGLEAMAAGGIACTGCSGEDYAVDGRNALVVQSNDARECVELIAGLRAAPERARSIRRAGLTTARQYAWPEVVERHLLPRVALAQAA